MNRKLFNQICVQRKRAYNKKHRKSENYSSKRQTYCLRYLKAQYKALLKEKKNAALKESWHKLIHSLDERFIPFLRTPSPTSQVPTHAWEEYFRKLYVDPAHEMRTRLIWIQPLTGSKLHHK
ncbi:hypothetical protein E2320_020875, partial [Naja naja]